jgi:hypothetical protein
MYLLSFALMGTSVIDTAIGVTGYECKLLLLWRRSKTDRLSPLYEGVDPEIVLPSFLLKWRPVKYVKMNGVTN